MNSLCRRLAANGLIVRIPGGNGKLVNVVLDQADLTCLEEGEEGARSAHGLGRLLGPRLQEPSWLDVRIQQLTADFADCVKVFEANRAFPGPSLYFHMRAIERRRAHQAVGSLLNDRLFLEYAYAVLPA